MTKLTEEAKNLFFFVHICLWLFCQCITLLRTIGRFFDCWLYQFCTNQRIQHFLTKTILVFFAWDYHQVCYTAILGFQIFQYLFGFLQLCRIEQRTNFGQAGDNWGRTGDCSIVIETIEGYFCQNQVGLEEHALASQLLPYLWLRFFCALSMNTEFGWFARWILLEFSVNSRSLEAEFFLACFWAKNNLFLDNNQLK